MERPPFDRTLSAWLANQYAVRSEVALATAFSQWRSITTQAANIHLRRLVGSKALTTRLEGRTKVYRLADLHRKVGLLDHSGGKKVTVEVAVDLAFTSVVVSDDGEGIFAKIKRVCELADKRESLLALAKGKLTTDPSRHSGEGVFFTSRALDRFVILSGGLSFTHSRGESDFLHDHADMTLGTTVMMRHAHTSPTDLKAVFDEYAAPEEYTFSKTVVPLRMALIGNEHLMSRSQARRVLTRVEKFQTVLLDFDGVEFVGQAFADEVFRVFAGQHPGMEIVPINAVPIISQMISRAMAGRHSGAAG